MKKQFFLSTLLAVTIAGFLLIWESPPESFLSPQTGKLEDLPGADSYMHRVTSFKYSSTGAKELTLSSNKASYYNKNSLLVLENPKLNSAQTNQLSDLKITATTGLLSPETETLELKGNVDARWNTAEGSNHLTASRVTYSLSSHIAAAENDFQLRTPQAQVTGQTLATDLREGTITITSKVRATYEPH